jgi:UDP-N-acetylmuramate--alanine ligase
VPRADAERVLPEFGGAGRRFERKGEAGGVSVYDDYGHHPSEIAVTLAAARSTAGRGRVLVAFQPHLYSRTRHLAHELAAALAAADAVAVTGVYAAREDPVEGVDGKLVVDELAAERPGMPVAWTPSLDDAVRFLVRRARPGDLVLTIGAGDVERAGAMILQELG